MSQHASAHAARSHKLRNTFLVITALLILLVIAGGVVGLNFYKQAKEVKAHEEQAVSSLSAITNVNTLKDAQASAAAIKQAQTHTATARDIANGTLWNMLSKMPVVGGDVTNVQGMTQVVDDLVQQTLPSLTDVVQQLANAQISGDVWHRERIANIEGESQRPLEHGMFRSIAITAVNEVSIVMEHLTEGE